MGALIVELTLAPIELFSPVAGDQEYVKPPVADNV